MRELNFAKKRSTWKVTIPYSKNEDGQQVLHIKSPSKNILTELYKLQSEFGNVSEFADEEKITARTIGAMWEFAAIAMSNNTEKLEIDPDELSDDLAIDDLVEFYKAYVEFINEQTEGKN
ncbi:MAG: hypothetical protein ACI4EA_03670 [Candidatus Ornithomonoglobus sp.]